MPRLLLVDGHSNLYRAFYAIRTGLTAPDGTPTAAAYGFLRMLQRLLRELAPDHVAVAFDVGKDTFRSRMDARYKAQRAPMPDELRVQIPITQEALGALGVPVLAVEDVEADDVIGSLAARAAEAGWQVVIASTDKDLMQLVRDPSVALWHTRLERLLDERGVEEAFGVPPERVVDVLALMGDSSDNVPGCPGIGEKGARELIRIWGSVDAVLAHADEVAPPRARKALLEHRAEVELSRELVTIRTDVPLPIGPDDLDRGVEDRSALAALYRRLGFTSLLAELGEPPPQAATAGPDTRVVSLADFAALLGADDTVAVAVEAGAVAVASAGTAALVDAPTDAIAPVLAGLRRDVWCYDAKSLVAWLRDHGTRPSRVPRDAMLAGYLLAPGEPVGLAAIAARQGTAAPTGEGPAERALAVARLAPTLARRLADEGLERVFTEIELPLVPVLEAMERRGITLDTAALADLSRRLESSLAALERDIHAEAGGPFNVNSPQQLAEVLFVRRGMPVLRRTSKTRAPSTDADVLAELAARGYRLPSLIVEYREQAKLKSTYVDALPRQVAPDGRVHTRFNQAVAATGRLSSSDPNLQNIPVRTETGREVRRAFVAAPGLTLLAADYSQIELRVLAHFSEDPTLAAAFAHGEDIHRATAALVLGVAATDVTDAQRRAAKTVNFGLIYGMSAFSLGRELGVDTAQAQSFIDAYFARLPRVRAFLDGIRDEARRTGKVRTLFGRLRFISGLDARNAAQRGNAERQAINAPIQGTAADLMKLAMIRAHGEFGGRPDGAHMLLQVHDELVLELPPADLAAVSARLRAAMEGVAELRVPLRVDIASGPSWADAKG